MRHLKSQWNLENRFTGWTDVPLCKEGIESAGEAAEKIKGIRIDAVYTSPLQRNRDTVTLVLDKLGIKVPVVFDKALDERNYGELQGLNKDEMKKRYGEEQVQIWRRSWDQAPPGGESLKDVYNRVVPFYNDLIKKDLMSGKNVLVIASHNSLRALVKYIENIPDSEISSLELPTGTVRQYDIV
jgi:2,3-bisphosphoglycerate-dependent phosphoglycerate mutase